MGKPQQSGERLTGALPGVKQTAANKVVKAKTKRGRRVLERREPKLVEDAKKVLLLYGGTTSQTIKDVLSDLHRLKARESVRYTRNNAEVRPFEAGGEASLEHFAHKAECGLLAVGSHSKKRPHNLTLGRMYDGHLYDLLEVGVSSHTPISNFKGAALAQSGNKPCILFAGQQFENMELFKQARSVLLDMFRGQQVESINLAGLDRVMVCYAVGDSTVLLRQYGIRFKKSSTRVPRVALQEMGPRLELALRRSRAAPADLESEAMKQPKLGKKKEKNVSSDLLDGKVGRIYMKPQTLDNLGLAKMKGLKRERRQAAAERRTAKQDAPADSDDASD